VTRSLPRALEESRRGTGPGRTVVLIDGEHYAPVVRAAIDALPHDVVAAVFVGGIEKLRGGDDYGLPFAASLEEAIEQYRPELVLDLSDEPVLGPVERLALASRALARGVAYVGADFTFEPPSFAPYDPPSLAVIGTGKRVGKTALTAHVARLLAVDRRVVVVAMGRGGPPEPDVVRVAPTVDSLLGLSRGGRHAASDHLEIAALTGVETVGCWRAGGGLAGAVAVSNVLDGARVAAGLGPDLVVFDGSGAALPPVAVGRRIVVVPANQAPAVATGYLNAYRIMLADLVVVTMAEEGSAAEAIAAAARALARSGVPVVQVVLRPRPTSPVTGRRVAFFGTVDDERVGGVVAEHLASAYGAEVVHVSGALADRARLRAEVEAVDADVLLVELKAAAIDVVAEVGRARGIDVVLAATDVLSVDGVDLDGEILRLAREVTS
jgi:cyclic 2,3-diphosphoglycerate synthetase